MSKSSTWMGRLLMWAVVGYGSACGPGAVGPDAGVGPDDGGLSADSGAGTDAGAAPEGALIPSSVGAPLGAEEVVMVGAEGGTVSSEDDRVQVVFPPGALPREVPISIQTISATAPGALGPAVRLHKPADVSFAVPVQISFKPFEPELGGVDPSSWRIGFQNSEGYWELQPATFDAAARTVTTTTTHFSDWALMPELRLEPGSALVRTGRSLTLKLSACAASTRPEQRRCKPGVDQACLAETCRSTTLAPASISGWAVEAIPGGNATFGTVAGNGATAVFTAPQTAPSPRLVHVSVTIDGPEVVRTLIANITIADDMAYQAYLRLKEVGENRVTGEGNAIYRRIENLPDVERYEVAIGYLTVSAQPPGCNRVDGITFPLQSSTGDRLIVYKPNSAYGQQMVFAAVTVPKPIAFRCGTPAETKTIYIDASILLTQRHPYTDFNSLRGRAAAPQGQGHYNWWMDRVREAN